MQSQSKAMAEKMSAKGARLELSNKELAQAKKELLYCIVLRKACTAASKQRTRQASSGDGKQPAPPQLASGCACLSTSRRVGGGTPHSPSKDGSPTTIFHPFQREGWPMDPHVILCVYVFWRGLYPASGVRCHTH